MKKRQIKKNKGNKKIQIVKKRKNLDIFKLIVSIAIPLLAGFIGSMFTMSGISPWYSLLNKPLLNPPSWVFSPVWTSLFILMGISLYLIWSKNIDEKKKRIPLFFFTVQLFLNMLWSLLFFTLRNPLYAFVEILVLWLTILFMIMSFYKISKTAAYLQVPYLLWVSFAAYLNFMIALLN